MLQKNSITQNIQPPIVAAGSMLTATNLLFSFLFACWHPMLVYSRTKFEYILADLIGATYQARAAS